MDYKGHDTKLNKPSEPPRSKLKLGNPESVDDVKNNYISTYHFSMKPTNPPPYQRVHNANNTSSIVLDVPSKGNMYTSEAMSK